MAGPAGPYGAACVGEGAAPAGCPPRRSPVGAALGTLARQREYRVAAGRPRAAAIRPVAARQVGSVVPRGDEPTRGRARARSRDGFAGRPAAEFPGAQRARGALAWGSNE